eukprot:4121508-Amphidinium_carterae.1
MDDLDNKCFPGQLYSGFDSFFITKVVTKEVSPCHLEFSNGADEESYTLHRNKHHDYIRKQRLK